MGITRILLRFIARLLLVAVVATLLLVLIEPLLIRHGLKRWLIHTAQRNGSQLTIREMSGSFLRGITVEGVKLESPRSGVTTAIDVSRAEADFSWKSILLNKGGGFFRQLILSDVESTITFTSRSHTGKIRNNAWLPVPMRLELRRGHLSLHLDKQQTELSGIDFQVDTAAPGLFTIERIVIGAIPGQPDHLPSRIFENLRGTTAFQGTRLVLAEAQLAPDIFLKTISTDLQNLNRGRVKVGFEFDAFDGTIRGELVNMPKEDRPQYEITGNFSHIAVPQLARFLDGSTRAGGRIDEGKFTFRGSPHALDKATFTTRLEAHDFQWGKRQWNTLVLGASIVNRRIHIPELHLKQAHNLLQLKGEVLLPTKDKAWWESDFAFDIAARFDDLKELSALVGDSPLTDLSGQMTIDGNVRGQDKTFNGHLIVAGSKLTYRDTPFDLLNAGLKLDGNEVQIINLELARGRDFIRGKGNVSILGKTRYSGELQANIDALETYSGILRKPITPYPLEGGVVLDWSGDGTLEAHSGAFTATFRKLRTPGSEEKAATLPVDVELAGTYAPGRLSLTNCRIAHDETRLETRLAAAGNSLTIDGLRLSKKGVPWLEGSAKLPVNLRQWWLSPGVSAIDFEQPLTIQLLANGIQVQEVARLTGRTHPISGLLSGSIQAKGTLRELSMNGSVTINKGKFPPGKYTPAFENLQAHAELKGRELHLEQFSTSLGPEGGLLSATGTIDLTRFVDPALDLTFKGEKVAISPETAWSGRANMALSLTGDLASARLSGEIALLDLPEPPLPPFGAVIAHDGTAPAAEVEPLTISAPSLTGLFPIAGLPAASGWTFDLTLATPTPAPLKLKAGSMVASLHYSSPLLPPSGSLTYTALSLPFESEALLVENATFFWHADSAAISQPSAAPSLPATHVSATVARLENKTPVAYYHFAGPINNYATSTITSQEMDGEALTFRPNDGILRSHESWQLDSQQNTSLFPIEEQAD